MQGIWLSVRDGIRALLGVFFLGLFCVFYSMFVIVLALYMKVFFDVAGLVTVFAALCPPIGVCVWYMHKREVKATEALAKGFPVSPEIQACRLDEYEQLLKKKKEETES
jgi:hypothetical protein